MKKLVLIMALLAATAMPTVMSTPVYAASDHSGGGGNGNGGNVQWWREFRPR
jgi:hypothetical protein